MKGALGFSIAALMIAPLFGTNALATESAANATTEIRVFASVAMAGPLRELGFEFEKEHPNVDVHYEFAAAGVFVTGVQQGIPPDLLVSAGTRYQEQLTGEASVNLYSTLARDHMVAMTPCAPPPCCNNRGVGNTPMLSRKNLMKRLTDPSASLVIASPVLSPAGQKTQAIFKAMGEGAYGKIMGHAKEVMDVGDVVQAVAHRRASIGIGYASQVLAMRRAGECVRSVALPSSDHTEMPFTVSVLNKSRFHAVDAERKKLDAELEALYLSRTGERAFADWGFRAAK